VAAAAAAGVPDRVVRVEPFSPPGVVGSRVKSLKKDRVLKFMSACFPGPLALGRKDVDPPDG